MSSKTTKALTMGQLQKGDIILSTTSAKVSKMVKLATFSKYSHARIYIGDQNIIEAVEPVVIKRKLTEVLRDDLYAVVYRMPGLTNEQTAKIVHYAKSQQGKGYDVSGAIGSSGVGVAVAGFIPRISNFITPEYDFYCSELVAFAYKSAGVKLETFSSQTTPEDLAKNKKLNYVGHLKVSGM